MFLFSLVGKCEVFIFDPDTPPYTAEQLIQAFGITQPSPVATAVPVPVGKPIKDLQRVKTALEQLNPDMEYKDWLAVGMALHDAASGGQEGLDLWDQWSAKGTKYDQEEIAAKWKSFKGGGGIIIATLFSMAPKPKPKSKSRVMRMSAIEDTEYKPLKWSIPNVLPEGLTLLAGPPKVKKSWLALNFALAVCSGGCALGSIPVDQGRVLYLALEDTERRLQSRARAVRGGNTDGYDYFDIATEWPRMATGRRRSLSEIRLPDGWDGGRGMPGQCRISRAV